MTAQTMSFRYDVARIGDSAEEAWHLVVYQNKKLGYRMTVWRLGNKEFKKLYRVAKHWLLFILNHVLLNSVKNLSEKLYKVSKEMFNVSAMSC